MGHLSVVQTSSSGLASKKRQTSEGGAVFDIWLCLFLIRHQARLTGFSVCPVRERDTGDESSHCWSPGLLLSLSMINSCSQTGQKKSTHTGPTCKVQWLQHPVLNTSNSHIMFISDNHIQWSSLLLLRQPVVGTISLSTEATTSVSTYTEANDIWGQMTTVLRMSYITRIYYDSSSS